jgi:hypothetical protein
MWVLYRFSIGKKSRRFLVVITIGVAWEIFEAAFYLTGSSRFIQFIPDSFVNVVWDVIFTGVGAGIYLLIRKKN